MFFLRDRRDKLLQESLLLFQGIRIGFLAPAPPTPPRRLTTTCKFQHHGEHISTSTTSTWAQAYTQAKHPHTWDLKCISVCRTWVEVVAALSTATGSVSTAIIKPSDNELPIQVSELYPREEKRPATGNVFWQVLFLWNTDRSLNHRQSAQEPPSTCGPCYWIPEWCFPQDPVCGPGLEQLLILTLVVQRHTHGKFKNTPTTVSMTKWAGAVSSMLYANVFMTHNGSI